MRGRETYNRKQNGTTLKPGVIFLLKLKGPLRSMGCSSGGENDKLSKLGSCDEEEQQKEKKQEKGKRIAVAHGVISRTFEDIK